MNIDKRTNEQGIKTPYKQLQEKNNRTLTCKHSSLCHFELFILCQSQFVLFSVFHQV